MGGRWSRGDEGRLYGDEMRETLHLTIRYQAGEEGRIVASTPQVPGALSQGRTREEARANVLHALRLMLVRAR